MLRWLFLFLLLVNVLLLFWFSGFKAADDLAGQSLPETRLGQIRLLSEIDSASLQFQQLNQSTVDQQCWQFSAFPDKAQAQWVKQLSHERGLAAEIITEPLTLTGYAVRVELDAMGDRGRLATYLQSSRALDITVDDLGVDDSYIVGLYVKQAEAEKELQQLFGLGLRAFMVYEEQPGRQYLVRVNAHAEQNLFKEIKAIVLKRHSHIKIEKKVCEGVARP